MWFSLCCACPNGKWRVMVYRCNQAWDGKINSLEFNGQTSKAIKDGLTLHPTYSYLKWHSPHYLVVKQFFVIHALWIGIGPSCLVGLHSQLRESMWRRVVYVYLCYVLVLFFRGGWYSSFSDTRLLFTWQLSLCVPLATTPYTWNFIHLELDGWIPRVGKMLLSEEPPPWLGILAKWSFVSECLEKTCVRWRLHVFATNLEFFSLYLHFWNVLWWSER